MSVINQVQMTFEGSNGNEIKLSYKYVKDNVSDSNIKAAMQGIVNNGNIFNKVPAVIKSAVIVSTNKREVDLS